MLKLEIAQKITEDTKRNIVDAENAWVESQLTYAHDYVDGKILDAIKEGKHIIFIEPYNLCEKVPCTKPKHWWNKAKPIRDWSNYTYALGKRVRSDYRNEGYIVSEDYGHSFSLSWRLK